MTSCTSNPFRTYGISSAVAPLAPSAPIVTDFTRRPLLLEVPLGTFAGVVTGEGPAADVPRKHATEAHRGGL